MKIFHFSLFLSIFIFLAADSFSQDHPSLIEIQKLIEEEVDNGRSSSIAIGIIDHGIESYATYGHPFEGRDEVADENTIYEIASLTKVYVSTILSDLVLKGKVDLKDPLVEYLPDTLAFTDAGFHQITIEHIATHTSGLTTFHEDLKTNDPDKYLEEMTYSKLFGKLERSKLKSIPGSTFEYSNNNYALVAYVICKLTNKSLGELFNQYYITPLEMNNTALTLDQVQKTKYATAYIRPGVPADHWDLSSSAYEGAGGLKSSTKDQLSFLKALFFENTPLAQAAEYACRVLVDSTWSEISGIGLGWQILSTPKGRIFSHKGTSTGFRTILAYDDLAERGIVIISNSSNDIFDIFTYLLDKSHKVNNFKKNQSLELEKEVFDKMKGFYTLQTMSGEGVAEIYTKDGQYFISTFEIFYQGEQSFFVPALNTLVEFTDLLNNEFQSIMMSQDSIKIGERIHTDQE